jgi:hypothetical protein
VFKQIQIGERFMLQYRLEAFNATNTVIYGSPTLDFNSTNFGKIPQPRGAIYPPRQLQMGLKLHF